MSKKKALRYQRVAAIIEHLIQIGSMGAGEKIPSVRKMSALQKVSLNTITQAYWELEKKGLIEARPQSGFYVKKVQKPARAARIPMSRFTPQPQRVSIGRLIAENTHAARDPEIVPLGAASPNSQLLPVRHLNFLTRSAIRKSPRAGIEYDFPPGCAALRHQIARRSIHCGLKIQSSEIIITSGCLEGINLSLRALTKPGDTIAIESPTYFGILQIIESLNLKAVEIPTHARFGLDVEAFRKMVGKVQIKACLFAPNYGNPQGWLLPDSQKALLVRIAEGAGIPIIEDDVFGELPFEGERPRVLKAFDESGNVILCSSFSKTLAPGYRVGWIVPGKYFREIEHLKYLNSMATASLQQQVIASYLATGGFDRHLKKFRGELAKNVSRFREAILEWFPAGTRVSNPRGGFVLWVELPAGVHGTELHYRALGEGISVSPGVMFSPSGRYQNFIRINSGHPWTSRMSQAIRILGKLATALKP